MSHPPAGFVEAIAWARARKAALPDDYYGPRFRELRARARTISGLAAVDQIQAVLDALDGVLARGGTFRDFKRAVDEGGVEARLPAHRLALIFRTNIQSAYAAGRWRQAEAGKEARPYLMYLAVNDARTRPSHRAMHGHIARVDDPWWKTHHPLNGFNCRCTTRTLTEAEARRRGIKAPPAAAPDPGWDYNPGMDAERGLAESARRKKAEAHPALARAVDAAMDARVAPVGDALEPLTARRVVRRVIGAIHAVHWDGKLPVIPVQRIDKGGALGAFRHRRGEAVAIMLANGNPYPEFTLTHEIGHFLDLEGIGRKGVFASETGELRDVMNAIRATALFARLEAAWKHPKTTIDEAEYLAYLLEPRELWARAYAQWIAMRGGDDLLLDQLRSARGDGDGLMQWSDRDFAPVAREMDRMMRDLGWMR